MDENMRTTRCRALHVARHHLVFFCTGASREFMVDFVFVTRDSDETATKLDMIIAIVAFQLPG